MELRKGWLDKSHPDLSIRRQCLLLGVNRSMVYYQQVIDSDDIWLGNRLRELWQAHPFLGYRKLTALLRLEDGLIVNDKRVLRLMRELGIQAIYPKPRLSLRNTAHKIYPYLLKEISIIRSNQVWMVNITYLRLGSRFVYLTAFIDVFSRYIAGWQLSFSLDTQSCVDALDHALKNGQPEIINCDQGCQFTSVLWITTLTGLSIQISMDGKGRWADNVFIERFWRTIKYEAIFLNDFDNYQQLYQGVNEYIEFYNHKRPHQSLDYQRPADRYQPTPIK